MKMTLIPALLSLLISTYALEEISVYDEITNKMLMRENCENSTELFWQRKVIETPKILTFFKNKQGTYRLRYSKFGCHLGTKGTLVVSPGRTESSPEYYETAIDFIKEGYSPVYVVDHRGQGLSPRLLEDQQKGHIETFNHYVSDFSYVTNQVLKDVKEMGKAKQPLFFTSNSMGSAIGVGYFQKMKEKNPYKAAALLGSQIRVNYLGVVKKDPTVWNNILYTEGGVIAQANYQCTIFKCGEYASEIFAGYKPEKRVFNNSEDNLTHSENRYELRNFIWDDFDWSKVVENEYQNENWSSPVLGGATNSWARAAARFNKKMRKKNSIKKMHVRLLVLTGTRDIRAYTPYLDGTTDLSTHKNFCQDVDRYSKSLCQFVPLEEAYHELYKENDYYRNQSMRIVLDFFAAHK
jgi:lysophospholipase